MRTLAAGAALAICVALLGSAPVPPPPASIAPTAPSGLDAGRPLIVVDELGGPTSLPDTWDPRAATLYADGTLVASDPRSGTLLSTSVARLSGPALDEAWAAVAGTGLAVDRSLDLPGLSDAGTTRIRTDDGARRTELLVYALGLDPVEDGATFPPDEVVLRANASWAIGRLRELAGTEPWTPPALLLWWGPYEDYPGGAVAPRVPWTPAVDLAMAGEPVASPVWSRCAVLEGATAADVAAFARGVPPGVVVEQAGTSYGVAIRPVYPDELGAVACPGS
jgi:hypothetical protein